MGYGSYCNISVFKCVHFVINVVGFHLPIKLRVSQGDSEATVYGPLASTKS